MTHKEPDKARRYLDQLDTARCNGEWEHVPELARKVEKHVPGRKCLTLTARVEYDIAASSIKRPSPPSASKIPKSLSGQISSLQTAADDEKRYPEDAFEAQVCIGWLHSTFGEPDLALARVPPDLASVSERLVRGGREPSGWTHVCIMKGAYIRGLSQEQAGSYREAIETYNSVLPQITDVETKFGKSYEYRLWTERLLIRFCVLVGRHVKSKSSHFDEVLASKSMITPSKLLSPFRAWSKVQASAPDYGVKLSIPTVLNPSRRRIWRIYYDILTILMSYRISYTLSNSSRSSKIKTPDFGTIFLFDSKLAQYEELRRVESAYEAILLNEVGFPQANEANIEVESWVDQVMSNWALLTGHDWQEEDLEKGGKPAVSRSTLAILYHAATKSFHSTRVLRSLFTVHTALAEFELASKALNTYLEIVSRGKARVEKSGKAEIGLDNDSKVLWTAAAGMSMLCIHGRRKQAARAQEVVNITEKWLEKHHNDHDYLPVESAEDVPEDLRDRRREVDPRADGDSIAAAARAVGLSRLCWSRLTYNPLERPGLHEQAVRNLRTSLRLDSSSASKIETFFDLALALAEKREINAAIESAKSGLSLASGDSDQSSDEESTPDQDNSSFSMSPKRRLILLKSWHLLSLLLTAKQNYDAAINSCEAALEMYGGHSALFAEGRPSKLLISLSLCERRNIVELKNTQLALLEVTEGPEEAVNASGELLSLYAKLFQYHEPPAVQLSIENTISPPESVNSGRRSFRASIFGHSRKLGPSNRKSQLVMGNGGSSSTESQISPQDTRETPTIQITSDGVGDTAAKSHHHHLLRHESNKLHKRDSRKSMGSVPNDRISSSPRFSTAKTSNQPNYNLPSRSRPSTASSSNQWSANSDPYASDEVGVAVSHNGPSTNPGPPAGLDRESSAVTPLPPTSQKNNQNPSPHYPKPPADEYPDTMLSDTRPPPVFPEPIFDPVDTKRHTLTLLIKIWLLMASLYRRASMPTDAAASLSEATTHVRTIETLVVQQNGSSNQTLVTPGWSGLKAVAELWADVLTEEAMQHVSKNQKVEAEEAYEKAVFWWPDHPAATVGLCNILLDSYAEVHPPITDENPARKLALMPLEQFSFDPKQKSTAGVKKKTDSTESLSLLAARDRAYGLLLALTKSGQGWDCSEAWMALARAYELSGQFEKAKEALWWVVELEEGRGVREWSVVGGW